MTMTLRGRLAQLRYAAPATAAIAVIYFAFCIGGIRVNASSSLPVGLYKITSDSTELVEFCPPEPFASLSALRGYRAKGSCHDGAEPLMKPIVAVEGSIVAISNDGLTVNGKLLPNSRACPFDTKGRPLTHWPFGQYRVAIGTVWVSLHLTVVASILGISDLYQSQRFAITFAPCLPSKQGRFISLLVRFV